MKSSEVIEQIKKIAKKINISTAELAKNAGKSRQSIYDMYSGKVGINIENLNILAEALNHKVEIRITPKYLDANNPEGVKLKELLSEDEIARLNRPLLPMSYMLEKRIVNLSVSELAKLFEIVYKKPIIEEQNTSTVALTYNTLARRAMEKNLPINDY